MSDIIHSAVEALSAKLSDFDGSVKFEIAGVGAIILDSEGVREGNDEAECTLTAEPDVFQGILSGDVNPTGAFMSGQLSVDGDMSQAMKLAAALA